MSTAEKNLSSYSPDSIPDGAGMRIGIVVSEWNEQVTGALLHGCENTLKEHGVIPEDILINYVPGSFELPFGAQLLVENTDVDAVVCLGCVIQGETRHFDFVCQGVTEGVSRVALDYSIPVIFGVLTTNDQQQALDRAGGKHGNKGVEAAIAALKMVRLQYSLEEAADPQEENESEQPS